MTDQPRADSLAARVRRLSPAQRALLTERLGIDGEAEARHLVAYVVPAPAADATADAIRAHVAQSVPEPLVPTVILVGALPRTETGKLDVRALVGTAAAARSARPITPPATPTEAAVVVLWRELLPTDRIGSDDNFFELGGHSLLATRLLSRVRAAFGVDVPLRRLFESPTVAGLAGAIDETKAAGAAAAAAPIVPLPRR